MKRLLFLLIFSNFIFSQDIEENLKSISNLDPRILEKYLVGENIQENNEIKNNDLSVDSKETKPNKIDSKVFGFDYVRSIPQSISSTSDLPVPNDYIISLGDELSVILSGGQSESFNLTVGLDGAILFPNLGKINIFGETISEVKEKISKLIELTYVGTNVSVSLSKMSARKINIVGAVNNPGTYIVNPFSTISTALAYSGGFKENSSLRKVKLIRGNDTYEYDLYELLIDGKRVNDINIQQGDTILVSTSKNFVEISGEVMRPYIYEYISNDTYDDLINKFAMGTTRESSLDNFYVEALKGNILTNITVELMDSIGENAITALRVFKQSFQKQLDIQVIGDGVEQNLFSAKDYIFLEDLISKLNFSNNIYPFYANLEQSNYEGDEIMKHSFSLSDQTSIKNIKFSSNAKVRFYSRENINDIQDILLEDTTLSANILDERILEQKEDRDDESEKEGLTSLREDPQDPEEKKREEEEKERIEEIISSISKKSLKSFYSATGKKIIPLEGSISAKQIVNFYGTAEDHKISNARLSKADGTTVVGFQTAAQASEINAIYVPKIFQNTISVKIEGLVNAPGEYDVAVGTTLNSLYQIAGGLLENADPEAVIFIRESIKDAERNALKVSKQVLTDTIFSAAGSSAAQVNSSNNSSELLPLLNLIENTDPIGRLTGDLKPDSDLSISLLIEDGDQIKVIPKRSTITIVGQVLQPLTVTFKDNLQVNDYIELSGGLSEYADKKYIYIIRKDGTSIPLSGKLSFNQIEEGDTIVVPRNLEKLAPLPLVSVATQIISNIAFAAASLNVLGN